jgi:1-acyl-sn-glycerol-3-phosphate acyltransferase
MLRASLFLLFFIPLTAAIATSAIFCTLIDTTGVLYHRHATFWARMGLLLAGVSVEVAGQEKVPADEPIIFMCNHQSNFDILALFRIPVFGHSMGRAGYIPLDRSDGRRALKSMDEAAAAIRNGRSVIIFPEGTRTMDGKLLPFKQGGFLLAGKAGVGVVPVTITGSMQINPPKRLQLRPGSIRVAFGEPIRPAAGTGSKQRESLMEQVRMAIAAGLEA